MPLADTDLEFRLSAPAASGGSEQHQNATAASLGRYVSLSVWAGGASHDLFDLITGDENAANLVEYRCLFLVNKSQTFSLFSAHIWLSQQASASAIALAVDPTPARTLTETLDQALVTDSRFTAPLGLTFHEATAQISDLSLGNVGPEMCKAFWVRRTALNTASAIEPPDEFSIRVQGEG